MLTSALIARRISTQHDRRVTEMQMDRHRGHDIRCLNMHCKSKKLQKFQSLVFNCCSYRYVRKDITVEKKIVIFNDFFISFKT